MNDFGNFLYTLRKERGMTQAELAAALGVTNKAVSKWETGEAMPETSLLLPLSRIFGVTVDELLDGRRGGSERSETDGSSPEISDTAEKSESPADNVLTRGKEENTVLDLICGAVCAAIVMLGITAYLIVGYNVAWEPYWVIMADCGMSCGIAGIVFDLCNRKRREAKISQGKNPYTDNACGLIMLSCAIVFVTVGALTELWHPLWIIMACGGLSCGIVAPLGTVFAHRKNRN